jgi:hypothetical protein
MANLTLAQIEDSIGSPIVLLTHVSKAGVAKTISVEDLSAAAQAVFVAWVNARLTEDGL